MQFKAWDKVFQETTNYLRDTLTRTLRIDKSLEKYGLQIDIVGLGVSPKGIRQPAIACITNRSEPDASRNQFKIVDPTDRRFMRYILSPTVQHYIGVSGSVGASRLAINGLRRKLQK